MTILVLILAIVVGVGSPILVLCELLTYRDRWWLETLVVCTIHAAAAVLAWWWMLGGGVLP